MEKTNISLLFPEYADPEWIKARDEAKIQKNETFSYQGDLYKEVQVKYTNRFIYYDFSAPEEKTSQITRTLSKFNAKLGYFVNYGAQTLEQYNYSCGYFNQLTGKRGNEFLLSSESKNGTTIIAIYYTLYFDDRPVLCCDHSSNAVHGVLMFSGEANSTPCLIARYWHGMLHGQVFYIHKHNPHYLSWYNPGESRSLMKLGRDDFKKLYFMDQECASQEVFTKKRDEWRIKLAHLIVDSCSIHIHVSTVISIYVL